MGIRLSWSVQCFECYPLLKVFNMSKFVVVQCLRTGYFFIGDSDNGNTQFVDDIGQAKRLAADVVALRSQFDSGYRFIASAPPRIIADSDASDEQRKAVAYVRMHYHNADCLDNGQIRIGVAANDRYLNVCTMLECINTDRQSLRNAMGY